MHAELDEACISDCTRHDLRRRVSEDTHMSFGNLAERFAFRADA